MSEVGLFDCLKRPVNDLVLAICCPCLAAGQIATRFEDEAPGPLGIGAAGKRVCCLSICPCTALCTHLSQYDKVGKAAHGGSPIDPKGHLLACCTVWCCLPCALAQQQGWMDKVEASRKNGAPMQQRMP